MKVKIESNEGMVDATIEMVDGVMVVSPKEVKFKPKLRENYYRPQFYIQNFVVRKDVFTNLEIENVYCNKGWVFKTEQECQEFCKILNQAIESVKPLKQKLILRRKRNIYN